MRRIVTDMTNRHTLPRRRSRAAAWSGAGLAALLLAGCGGTTSVPTDMGFEPLPGFAVTDNNTPYSQCLAALAFASGDQLPSVAVGEVSDKTGQFNYDENGFALSQGASEMVMSALFKTGKVQLVERFDLRVAETGLRLRRGKLIAGGPKLGVVPAADFIVLGALTELNYNIVSGGARLNIAGIGAGSRTVVVNVALDLRLVDARSLRVAFVSSLQKQIHGYEVDANVFRFFGTTLVEFEAGAVRNEPLQLGVRSVVEMAVYQLMTDYLGLPPRLDCRVASGYYPSEMEEGEL